MSMRNEVPTGWEDRNLGEIVKFSGGAQPPRSTFIYEPEDGYVRLIQTRDYKTSKYKTYIPSKLARKKCNKDDIMIGRYGPPIFQIFRGLEGAYNVALLKAIPNEKELNKEYLYYFITQYNVWAFVENLSQRSGGQTGVDLDQLRKYPFPLPPLPEQQKIANILSTVDEKIAVIDQQITATEELKKGLMQRLLTKGIGHTEFKDSPLGEIPKSWEVKKISEVADFRNGKGHEKIIDENGAYIVVNSKFISSDGKVIKKSNQNLSPLNKGDITMVMSDVPNGKALSKCYLVDENGLYTLNQRICLIRAKDMMNNYFLYLSINRNRYFLAFDNGVGQTNLKKSEVLDCLVKLPSMKEQNEITEILNNVDTKLQTQKDKKQAYQQLKKGLMQQLLTGKIRVNNLNEA
ncbi:restriction endonuclease subunit S [Mesonia mobilis]|uniref:Restriction endonuclease subunit S n=1 Tax=Mesonia mobilis TaxID=369791 RepID=A0ABQ3BV55_9FLAO|nr:restriction endonuclease subunit S [Mesonia mobilis]GGZ55772.1 restriction endonuclease subunit S [Mesonia mobilis]